MDDTYRYALSITSQFFFCGIPFRLDSSSICSFGCKYCFALAKSGKRGNGRQLANVDAISRKIDVANLNSNRELDINGEMLKHKMPLHIGGISDPFASKKVSEISLKLLEVLCRHKYPIVISTKNPIYLLQTRVMNLIKSNPNLIIQISISTSDQEKIEIIEPHTISANERIKCISILSNEGLIVYSRLQPLFMPWITELTQDLIPRLGEANCKHVSVEFLKLSIEKKASERLKKLLNTIGWNAYQDYSYYNASLLSREWVLRPSFKWEIIQPIVAAIRKGGMTYGAADAGLNHLGDTNCCCGIDRLPGFEGWFKGNFSNVIRNSSGSDILFTEVSQYWMSKKSISMYVNSHCRSKGGLTTLDLLHDKWNRPGTVNAPNTFLGVSWSGEYDSSGNCIYTKSKIPI